MGLGARALTRVLSCALLSATFCWGANDFGQLGNGSDRGSAVPVRVRSCLGVDCAGPAEATAAPGPLPGRRSSP